MSTQVDDDAVSVASSSNSSISSINSQLLSYGWTKRPLNLDGLSERNCNDVISVLFELLGSASTNIDNLDALNSRHRTLQYEYERTQKALSSTRAAQRRVELEANGWRSRAGDLEKKLGREEGRGKELRDEVARGRKALEGVRIAAGHESRKLQFKLDAANTKLVRLANEPSGSGTQPGLVVLNSIAPGRSQPVASGQAPLLEQSLRDLAEARANMGEELEAFGHVVVSTANSLKEVLAASAGQEETQRYHQSDFFTMSQPNSPPQQLASSSSHPEIAQDRLQSLISSVRSKMMERVIRIPVGDGIDAVDPEELEALARAERDRENAMQDLHDKVKDLEIELGCAKGREEEARKSLDEYVKRHMQDSMNKAAERDQDANQFLDIMREREKLEDERRTMVENVSRMNKDRRLFERERQAFWEEKRRADVDDVLAQLPNTPSASASHSTQPRATSTITTAVEGERAVTIHTDIHIPLASTSPWAAHRPTSPSPLSPHKIRTPKAHMAKNKRAKTPLSRLVLEKAVRRKSLAAAELVVQGQSSSASSAAPSSREALGDGNKRLNNGAQSDVGQTSSQIKANLPASVKGKEKASGNAVVKGPKAALSESVRAAASKPASKSLSSSTAALSVSQRKPADLGKSSGIGPKAAKTKGVWR